MNRNQRDAAVAKAADITYQQSLLGYLGDGIVTGRHPSLDWNALLAAVQKLEEKGYRFQRDKDRCWRVYVKQGNVLREAWTWDVRPETEALSRCVYTVMEREDG